LLGTLCLGVTACAQLDQEATPAVRAESAAAGEAARAQSGTASYYGRAHHGRRTASGARFDQNALTAAHATLPFGTRVRVTHQATGKSIVVVINDRLPSRNRLIDLSYGAARELGILRQGVATVVVTPV
jgi:rare lipoprotein A